MYARTYVCTIFHYTLSILSLIPFSHFSLTPSLPFLSHFLTSISPSLPFLSHSHFSLTPISLSLPHFHFSLTPISPSLPFLPHSHFSLTPSLTPSLPHSLTPISPSLPHFHFSLTPITSSFTPSLPHSFTPSLPHSFTPSLPHSHLSLLLSTVYCLSHAPHTQQVPLASAMPTLVRGLVPYSWTMQPAMWPTTAASSTATTTTTAILDNTTACILRMLQLCAPSTVSFSIEYLAV